MKSPLVSQHYIFRLKSYVIFWLWEKFNKYNQNKNPSFTGKGMSIVDLEKEYFDKLTHVEQSLLVSMWQDETERN